MNILGLDPSISSFGCCYNGDFFSIVTTPKDPRYERIDQIVQVLEKTITENPIDFIALEQYAFMMRKTNTLTDLAELGGVIKHLFYKHDINPYIISSSQWKSLLFNNTKVSKSMILKEVYKQYGKDCKNSDEADAFGIYKAMSILVNGIEDLGQSESEHRRGIIENLGWRMVKLSGMLDRRLEERATSQKKKETFYYKGKVVGSIRGLSRYAPHAELAKVAKDEFYDMYKVRRGK